MSNQIELWIRENLRSTKTTSVSRYDRMHLQSGGKLMGIYQKHDCTNVRHWRDTALCAAFIDALNSSDGTILDVGPGDGWPSLIIAPHFKKVIGIDPSATRVKVQRENAVRMGKKNCEFLQMDVNRIEFPDAMFDGVVAASSIEQLPDPVEGLREIFRVLKPGKCLAMTFENYDHYRPDGEESEDIEVEMTDAEYMLLYIRCTRNPAREVQYTLFLEPEALQGDIRLVVEINSIRRDGTAWLRSHNLIEFLTVLQKTCTGCEYFELSHFTSGSLDKLLRNIGYVDIRGFDRTISGLIPFVELAIELKKVESFNPMFEEISKSFGIASVRGAIPKASDFTIARKPHNIQV